jgi:hypothetical protein
MSIEAIRRGMFRTVRTRLNLGIGHLLIDRRADDSFLVSYPRSGNTWLRSMLIKVLEPEEGVSAAFNGVKLFGVSIRNTLRMRALPSPRLIKSHTWYRSDIPRAVYLVRDGRDALVSLYHFEVTKFGGSESFDDFFAVYARGGYGQPWHNNVLSWLDAAEQRPDDILVIHFEEMKKEPARILGEVTRFFGIQASETALEAAVEATSIERLRVAEKSRFPDRKGDQSAFRGGRTGQWRDLMTPAILDRFMHQAGEAMRRAGYL